MFLSTKCQLCQKGNKVCSRLEGMTCGQCMQDQKGCSAIAPKSECLTHVQCQQTLTPLKPEKGTRWGMTKWKDVMSLKPVTGQEAAGGSEPSPLGQQWSSCQAVARPAIVDIEESARELEESEVHSESQLQRRKMANQAL